MGQEGVQSDLRVSQEEVLLGRLQSRPGTIEPLRPILPPPEWRRGIMRASPDHARVARGVRPLRSGADQGAALERLIGRQAKARTELHMRMDSDLALPLWDY